MDNLNYKERLAALRKGGFREREISRLYHLREKHAANPLDMAPADLGRLRFIRWLFENGRLTDWPI
jgi:hypothetical protein